MRGAQYDAEMGAYAPLGQGGSGYSFQQSSAANAFAVSPLKGSLNVFHGSTGIVGASIAAYATILFIHYHRTGYVPPEEEHHKDIAWSLYILAGFGGIMCVGALIGHLAVRRDSIRLVAVSIISLIGMMLIQSILILFLFTDVFSWKHSLPEDPSGWWTVFSEYISTHQKIAKLVCIALLCIEFLGLLLTFWLQSIYQHAYEEWLMGVEERQQEVKRMLDSAAQQSYGSGVHSGWNDRARAKYGMDSSSLRQGTQAVQDTVSPLVYPDEDG